MLLERIVTYLSFVNFRRLLLLLTGLTALLLLVEAARFLPVKDENVHTESAYVISAQRWHQGLPLYSDFRSAPYLITPFPPLWYGILQGAQATGITDLDSLTFFARLLSFVSMLGIAVLAYFWSRKANMSPATAALGPAFYLTVPLLIPMAVIARQDFPALLLSFAAIYIVALRPTTSAVMAGIAFAALAYLTKHSSVAAATTIVLWLASFRRWKHAVIACVTWGVIVFPVMLYFQSTSHGAMMMNLSGSKFGPFGFKNLHDIVVHLMSAPGSQVMLAIFGFALAALLRPLREINSRDRMLAIYFLVSLPLALFAAGFANATANHFLEPVLIWALLVPVAVNALEPAWQNAKPQAALLFALSLVLLLPTLDVQLWSTRNEHPDDIRDLKGLVAGKRIFTDVSYLGARSANPGFLDPISLNFAERAGAWSSKPLLQELQAGGFELVVLHWRVDDARWGTIRYPRLSDAIRKAIAGSYGFCFERDTNFFYAPKTANSEHPAGCPAVAGAQNVSGHKE
ncbi:MAG TPA: hypothetical protein VEW69_07810 [Alphaproteobacteria bacterium]|nr:hypothetical protein [Alphaproteobacteria bacterium]